MFTFLVAAMLFLLTSASIQSFWVDKVLSTTVLLWEEPQCTVGSWEGGMDAAARE